MILKKPYAFLIKYFKIIHGLLGIFSIYLITVVNNIVGFYDNFIKGVVTNIQAIDYINSFYILVIFLSILVCLIVMVLMRHKGKPYLLYVVLIAVYLAIGFIIGYANKGLEIIYSSVMGMKSLLLYRDILNILLIFQYISFCFILVRALGFDIKKFDFDKDLHGFEVNEEDNEEVEFVLKDTNKYGRRVRREIRELKYYYLENKIFINCILGIVIVIFFSNFVYTNKIVNREYGEGSVFSTDNFTFMVDKSYISNVGYDNVKIKNNDTSFVIVKLDVKSNGDNKILNVGNLLLNVGDVSYTSDIKYSKSFKDLGNVYRDKNITNSKESYIFIYNVENDKLNKNMYLFYGNNIKVKLNPVNLDVVNDSVSYKINEELNLSETMFGSGSFKITSYELGEKFNYSYTYEVSGQVMNSNITIKSINNLILHIVVSGSYPNGLNSYSFLNNYGVLKYSIGDKEYKSSFDNKSPKSYKEGIYVNVNKDISLADKIWFEIDIRNKRYVYNLK